MISAADWDHLERGLAQRVVALERFLDDAYGEQRIFRDGKLPAELVLASRSWFPQLRGVKPPGGVRIHVAGIDLVRDPHGTFQVLEDNLRTPSGVSYVLENRIISKRVLPEVFDAPGSPGGRLPVAARGRAAVGVAGGPGLGRPRWS